MTDVVQDNYISESNYKEYVTAVKDLMKLVKEYPGIPYVLHLQCIRGTIDKMITHHRANFAESYMNERPAVTYSESP